MRCTRADRRARFSSLLRLRLPIFRSFEPSLSAHQICTRDARDVALIRERGKKTEREDGSRFPGRFYHPTAATAKRRRLRSAELGI